MYTYERNANPFECQATGYQRSNVGFRLDDMESEEGGRS
jgi:hypothetical protein